MLKPAPLDLHSVDDVLRAAVREDLGAGDITSLSTVPESAFALGRYTTKQSLVVSGLAVVERLLAIVDSNLHYRTLCEDGDDVEKGTALAEVRGPARSVLAAERVTLNMLQRMCGIATLTAEYVDRVNGTEVRVADTRKTVPGLRLLDKYAVACGGGLNHRMGLFDAVLIKNNHLEFHESIGVAIKAARAAVGPQVEIEVEVPAPDNVPEAIEAGADMILLDNFTPAQTREAVALCAGRVPLESSGGITLDTIRDFAEAGVDRISVGALTHSPPAVDIHLQVTHWIGKLDELLFALMQNMTIAVSGEKLARDLGVSHSTLARWVDKLRAAGAEIRGELFTGYRLTRIPDILLPQILRPRLRTQTLGRSFFHFYSVDSTNGFAARMLSHGRNVPDGALILSESQTAGRGRIGRSWHSEPENGLYFSLVLRPQVSPSVAPLFTLGCAVALHNAVERNTRLDVDIKWPNDLLVEGKKIAGILAEIQAETDRIHSIVVGVGLNVNHQALPEEIADRATSLRLASGRSQSRLDILVDFLEQYEVLLERFRASGPGFVVSEWTRYSSFASGRRVEVSDGYRTVRGVTCGLNQVGALRIETSPGNVEDVYSGDLIKWDN